MTEWQWRESTDPMPMLEFLRQSGNSSERKLRLFAAACSRRVWQLIDDLARAAVMAAEQFADGLVEPTMLRSARLACKSAGSNSSWYAAASDASIAARNAALSAQMGRDAVTERLAQTALIRDVFGCPFGEIVFDSYWRTPKVLDLARAIYDELPSPTGCNDRLPILADALMEAGYDNAEIFSHCRSGAPHVRGCWVVDLVLGKE